MGKIQNFTRNECKFTLIVSLVTKLAVTQITKLKYAKNLKYIKQTTNNRSNLADLFTRLSLVCGGRCTSVRMNFERSRFCKIWLERVATLMCPSSEKIIHNQYIDINVSTK